ncbi:rhodanese-like domain-containing protein [Streptomyces sp. NPDC059637]|uniref:rhodanese-like domain-containing protein n=1 Tax=Streptomyces sp. NPDC059637 TaxID=3347752 RepID=UPI0036CC54BE
MSTDTRSASPTRLTPSELGRLLADGRGPRLIDVRTPAEFKTSHIAGSYNVPLNLLREHRAELANHLDEEVVLICRSGGRAAMAEEALAEAGLPNLRVLEGGITAWDSAGQSLEYGEPHWDLERQVRLVAGSIVLATGIAGIFVPGLHLVGTFVGGGLVFAAITNTCGMGMMLSKLPYNRGPRTSIQDVVASLKGHS